jgi:hypothetical protein
VRDEIVLSPSHFLSRTTRQRRAEGDAAKRKKKSASQTRYTCHGCGVTAWAKPDVRLVCGDCDEKLEADPDAA